jgi:hypothetical protein
MAMSLLSEKRKLEEMWRLSDHAKAMVVVVVMLARPRAYLDGARSLRYPLTDVMRVLLNAPGCRYINPSGVATTARMRGLYVADRPGKGRKVWTPVMTPEIKGIVGEIGPSSPVIPALHKRFTDWKKSQK